MNDVTLQKIQSLIRNGAGATDIACELDVSYRKLQSLLRKDGTSVRQILRHIIDEEGGIMRRCKHHGFVSFEPLRGDGSYGLRCVECYRQNTPEKRSHSRERRRHTKNLVVAMLGGRCLRCGYDRCSGALQAHHRDPAQKRTRLSRLMTSRQNAFLESEKCDLLCANCHAIWHDEQRSEIPTDRKQVEPVRPNGHKGPWCKMHGEETEFYLYVGSSAKCKICEKKRIAQYRRNTKKRLMIDMQVTGCSACHRQYPPGCMQWHHVDPAKKEFSIGARGNIKAYSKVLQEAAKCDAVCANCHAEKHCTDPQHDHNHNRV